MKDVTKLYSDCPEMQALNYSCANLLNAHDIRIKIYEDDENSFSIFLNNETFAGGLFEDEIKSTLAEIQCYIEGYCAGRRGDNEYGLMYSFE